MDLEAEAGLEAVEAVVEEVDAGVEVTAVDLEVEVVQEVEVRVFRARLFLF